MKYLSLDYWMHKLGYRRTHWTDDWADKFITAYLNNDKSFVISGKQVTLSVKKMKE